MKKKIIPILKRQGVTKAAFFGSVARGEANKNSDVDILDSIEKIEDHTKNVSEVKLFYEPMQKIINFIPLEKKRQGKDNN